MSGRFVFVLPPVVGVLASLIRDCSNRWPAVAVRGVVLRQLWRCCMKTRCGWDGVARTSRDPPQEPHFRG